MSSAAIWRYLSLAKYVDLLRTQCLFFPKASSFVDTTEGKWLIHVLLRVLDRDDGRLENYAQQLEEFLARIGNDPSVIRNEANILLKQDNIQGVLRDVLTDVSRGADFPYKRREYLESMLSGWRGVLKKHVSRKGTWISQTEIYRESTYISCWNRLNSMSLAMWELYSKGEEGVAIRSTKSKLRALIDFNSALLEEYGLEGEVVAAQYFDELGNPSKETEDRAEGILMKGLGLPPALFSIKPNIFKYEHEIRAVIYPKREPFDPIANPYPNRLGFGLPIGKINAKSEPSVARFINAVHIHPTLRRDSMMFQVVSDINKRFGVESIEVVAEPIIPFEE